MKFRGCFTKFSGSRGVGGDMWKHLVLKNIWGFYTSININTLNHQTYWSIHARMIFSLFLKILSRNSHGISANSSALSQILLLSLYFNETVHWQVKPIRFAMRYLCSYSLNQWLNYCRCFLSWRMQKMTKSMHTILTVISNPFVLEFEVLQATFIRLWTPSTELDILSMDIAAYRKLITGQTAVYIVSPESKQLAHHALQAFWSLVAKNTLFPYDLWQPYMVHIAVETTLYCPYPCSPSPNWLIRCPPSAK